MTRPDHRWIPRRGACVAAALLAWAPLFALPAAGGEGAATAVERDLAAAAVEQELTAAAAELGSAHQRFGLLFAYHDGTTTTVHTAGEVAAGDRLRLASISKTFVAFLFLREGPSPEEPIARFFPADRHPEAEVITARMLLEHTSGVGDEVVHRFRALGESPDPAAVRALLARYAEPAPPPDERITALFGPHEALDFPPGSRWCYSNTGYLMLGRMLERVTGEPVQSLLDQHFADLAPSLRLDDGSLSGFPASYLEPWPIHWSHPWVAGGLTATAADALAAFHHLTEQPELALMQQWATAPRCRGPHPVLGDDYGLGLQRYDLERIGEGVGHDGHIQARSMLFRLGPTSYLVHTTRGIENPELAALARRLLTALLARAAGGRE
jgi:D-alanyl-D-alanine carboxypeptidase